MKRISMVVFSMLSALAILLSLAAPVLAQAPPLPDPPPRGTIEGPPPSTKTSSYAGGILFVNDSEKDWTEPDSQFLGEIKCSDDKLNYIRTVDTKTGLSLQGPVGNEQSTGITDAIKALRQPTKVKLTYVMQGAAGFTRSWSLTGVTYHLTRYRILAVRQVSPAQNELIGYFDVSVPSKLEVKMDEKPCPVPAVPDVTIPSVTPGVKGTYEYLPVPGSQVVPPSIPGPSLFDKLRDWFAPPPEGLGSIFSFGEVKTYSGSELFGAAFIGIGETMVFRLPPGSYSVRASLKVVGIPFTIDAGSASASVPIILSVSLVGVEVIWYSMLIVAAAIALAIALWLLRLILGAIFGGGKKRKKEEDENKKQGKREPFEPVKPVGGLSETRTNEMNSPKRPNNPKFDPGNR